MARAKKVVEKTEEVQAVETPVVVETVETNEKIETMAVETEVVTPVQENRQEIQWMNPASLELDPDQPREKLNDEAIVRYTEMCKHHGLPVEKAITVVKHPDGKMVVKNGNHRCAAAVAAGLKEIPVILIELSAEDLAPEKMARLRLEQLLDNLTVPMTPMEEINTIEQAIRDGLEISEVSKLFGISPATIEKNRAIASAPGNVKAALNNGSISKQTAIRLAEMIAEGRVTNTKKALAKAIEGKTAKMQIAKIEAYADEVARSLAGRQKSLFEKDEKTEKSVQDKNLICIHNGKPFTVENAGSAFKRLENAVNGYLTGPLGNGHAGDVMRKMTPVEVEQMVKSLAALTKKLDGAVTDYRARIAA